MLKKPNRITKKSDFSYIYKKGRVFFTPNLKFIYLTNNYEFPRVGFVVSSKASKRAVVRNRIKRVLRNQMQKVLEDFNSNYDIVCLVKPGIKDENLARMRQEVDLFLKNRKILKND